MLPLAQDRILLVLNVLLVQDKDNESEPEGQYSQRCLPLEKAVIVSVL